MPTHHLSTSTVIPAPPERVYGIIADYRDAHPSILPKPPFVSLTVEEGGTGAGTKMLVQMRVLGRNGSFRSVVTEPEPGRVLVETNDNGSVTTFTVEPRAQGGASHVTIATALTIPSGILGKLQAWFMTRLLVPVYEKELENLAAAAAERS